MVRMLEKKIKFTPFEDFVDGAIEPPKPASQFVPEWYRKTGSLIDPEKGIRMSDGNIGHYTNLTVKRCVPFFDAMTSGYIVTLPSDVLFVDPNEFKNRVLWNVTYPVVGSHGLEQLGKMPIPEGYDEVMKWNFPFVIKTPPGYSCMFMHPNFLYDVPFMTISGIVDTDKHPVPINFPFFIKHRFLGKIEKGTPICQIIPFKRDAWKSETGNFDRQKMGSVFNDFYSMIEKSYRNRFWSRKSYK